MLRLYDFILSAGGVGLLVICLAAINSDLRRYIVNIVHGDTRQLLVVAAPINRYARAAMQTVNDYRSDNTEMFAFGVAAFVLVGFLFKS